jgi:putative ATP-dependent endonuclease of OLD family
VIHKVRLCNFKIFSDFTLELNPDLNIIVGNNEAGKSTILEAIAAVLTKRIAGRPIDFEISPHLFNLEAVKAYVGGCREGKKPDLPRILIELYLADLPDLQQLRGNNNSLREDCPGVKLEIVFDDDFKEDYSRLLEQQLQLKTIPAEYYRAHLRSFADNDVTPKSLRIVASHIDATSIRLQTGTDYYLQNIIEGCLDTRERIALSVAYRSLKEKFADEPSIKNINKSLTESGAAISKKTLAMMIDTSKKSNWDTNLVPHLDDIPFLSVGRGEQSIIKTLLALKNKGGDSHLVLIEEPENHLSFARMNALLAQIQEACPGKQIIIATHSAYVLNKLGIDKVILLHECRALPLKHLSEDTKNYFKKLSGYDTLRLILADRAILVEGPSDELVVQKAFRMKHGRLPIQDGVDVINVRGLSFKRFLEIADALQKTVTVVTDNDGDYKANVEDKYAAYSGHATIRICGDRDNGAPSLEPQIVKCNGLASLNELFGCRYKDEDSLLAYMTKNKTEWALKLFEAPGVVQIPPYIQDAVA